MDSLTSVVIQDSALNTWFYPRRDRHYLLKPMQLTNFLGVRGGTRDEVRSYTTPDNVGKYILYLFSGINPSYYGMDLNFWEWVSIADLGAEQDMAVAATWNGRMLQLDGVKFQYLPNDEMVVAVPVDNFTNLFYTRAAESSGGTMVGNLLPHETVLPVPAGSVSAYPELLIRVYSNQWFTTTEGAASTGIHTQSVICNAASDAQGLIGAYNAAGYRNTGFTQWFVDGYLVDEPLATALTNKEVLQYRHDASGLGYFDILIANLDFYTSTKDAISKYVIVPPPHVSPEALYWDDLDIYVCAETNPNDNPNVAYRGFAYHKEQDYDIRQLSHRDLALSVDKVTGILTEQASMGVIVPDTGFIRIFYRNATGFARERLDSSYLLDLNSLPYHIRYNALTASNGPSIWKADVLEQSNFMKWATATEQAIMDSNYTLVEDTLSYIGLQAMLLDYYETSPGVWTIPKLATVEGATVVELDSDGILLNHQYLTVATMGTAYNVTDPNTAHVLFYPGTAFTADWGEAYLDDAATNVPVSPFLEYRYFRTNALSTWTKAVQGTHYQYDAVTDTVSWLGVYGSYELKKRNAGKHLVKELTIPRADYTLPIVPVDSGSPDYIATGFERWDVWQNGRKLVNGVGFVVSNQQIFLCDKEFWNSDDSAATVVIIGYGLSGDTAMGTQGFVINECINYNDEHDILKHRMTRLFIEGKQRELDQVYLAENYMGNETFTITDDKVYDYVENTAYLTGQVVMYMNRIPLVSLANQTTTTSFDNTKWVTLSSTATYQIVGTNTYVQIVPFGVDVMVKKVYENGTALIGQPLTALDTSLSYLKVLGVPLATPVNNGALYEAYNAPMMVTDMTPMSFSDTPAEYRTMTNNISNWLTAQLPALPTTDTIYVPNQHRIVSIYMQKIIEGLQNGSILIPNLQMSKTAMGILLADLEPYRLMDPAQPGKLDQRFIMIYPHVGETSVGLTANQINFLYSVNDYFMDGNVNMTINLHIA